jgi:hypothetical protein
MRTVSVAIYPFSLWALDTFSPEISRRAVGVIPATIPLSSSRREVIAAAISFMVPLVDQPMTGPDEESTGTQEPANRTYTRGYERFGGRRRDR